MEKKRTRAVVLKVLVTEEEKEIIYKKMYLAGYSKQTANFSSYARKMLIDGRIIKVDFSELKKYIFELNRIGVNINQLTKRANETRNIYSEDINDLKEDFKKMKTQVKEVISKFLKRI